MVKPVATYSESDEWATSVENWGESETTKNPHTKSSVIKIANGNSTKKGSAKQQSPDPIKDTNATFLLPADSDQCPPKAQLIPPTAIAPNDHSEIFDAAKPFICP